MPSTRLIVRGAPLPVSFKGDLNQLWQAMLDRLEVISPFGEVQLQIGGLMPTSNKGPWLKDGTQFWVWDEATKTYVPLDISASNGAMEAALAAALAGFVAARAEVTAEIAAAVGAIPPPVASSSVHFSANQTTELSSGSLNNSGVTVDIPFNSIETDSESGFSGGSYTIKKAGFYSITFSFHIEVASGSATNYGIIGGIIKNGAGVAGYVPGVSVGGSAVFNVTYQGAFIVGDRISATIEFYVSGGPATFRVVTNGTRLSGFLTP